MKILKNISFNFKILDSIFTLLDNLLLKHYKHVWLYLTLNYSLTIYHTLETKDNIRYSIRAESPKYPRGSDIFLNSLISDMLNKSRLRRISFDSWRIYWNVIKSYQNIKC